MDGVPPLALQFLHGDFVGLQVDAGHGPHVGPRRLQLGQRFIDHLRQRGIGGVAVAADTEDQIPAARHAGGRHRYLRFWRARPVVWRRRVHDAVVLPAMAGVGRSSAPCPAGGR